MLSSRPLKAQIIEKLHFTIRPTFKPGDETMRPTQPSEFSSPAPLSMGSVNVNIQFMFYRDWHLILVFTFEMGLKT